MCKILVVDDNKTNLMLVNEILEGTDYRVLFAENGLSALSIIESELPDLVLLDIMMPGMNGFDVCSAVKLNKKVSSTPIIIMSALCSESDIVKGLNLGAVDYVTKPFNERELLARIKTHLTISSMKKEIEEKNEKLEKALVFKSHIISMASHELRRPMTMIAMLSQISEKKCIKAGYDEFAKNYYTIRQLIKNSTVMLDEFIMISKNDLNQIVPSPVKFDIRQLCEEVIEESKLLTEKITSINLHFVGSEESMVADLKLMKHILNNLISNAIKYSPGSDSIDFTYSYEDNNWVFTVKDNGIGIPEQNQSTLFDEFVRADNVTGFDGCGLGLSIVKQFVEKHNGTITFESEVDVGSTFTVSIPNEKIVSNISSVRSFGDANV